MKKSIVIVVPALIVAFIVVFFMLRHRDERRIRKHLSSLAATVSKPESEDNLAFIVKTQKIKTFFTEDCQILVGDPVPDIEGLEMLAAVFSQVRGSFDEVDVDFRDISIIIGEGHTTAKTVMTAKAIILDPHENKRFMEVREIEMSWEKIKGRWKIAEARAAQSP